MKQGSQLVPSAQAAPFSAISPVGETAARCVLARAFAKQDGKAAGGTEFKASAADCAVRPGKKENFMLTVTDVSLQFAGSTLYVGPGTYGIAYVEAAESGMNRESIVKTA